MNPPPASDALQYYRTQCDELGARIIGLQEELRHARGESQHHRTLAHLIERIYTLADGIAGTDAFPVELAEPILMLLVERLPFDAAAFLRWCKEAQGYRIEHGIGLQPGMLFDLAPPSDPATAVWSGAAQLAAARLALGHWITTADSPWILLLASREGYSGRREPAARQADRAIGEAVIRIFDGLLSRWGAALALRDSEAGYKALFESAQDAILLLDLSASQVLEANHKAVSLIGRSPDEICQQSPDNWLVPDEIPALKRVWKQALHHRPQRTEARILGPDGEILWTEMNLKRIETRQPVLLWVIRDITDRKRAEQAVEQLHERLELALEGGELGLYDINLNTGEMIADDRFVRILGGDRERAPRVLDDWIHAIHPEDQARIRQVVDELRDGRLGKTELEYRIRHQAGRWIWLLTRGKAFEPDEFGRPRRAAGSCVDISARKTSEASIHQLAYYDPLTELPNRRLFLDRLAHAQAAALRRGHIGSVLFLDLDRFKRINDARGHDFGDQLLTKVAERLLGLVRHEDTIARFGGDEFVILIAQVGLHEEDAQHHALIVAEKIRLALAEPFALAGGEVNTGASIGISFFNGGEIDPKRILREADTALYRAKDGGRNCVCFFETSMQLAAEARFSLEKELRQAIEQQQLELYLQPQMDANGQAVAAEALVRWKHPLKGHIPPDQFIPLAEETGLILAIGRWVINQAIQTLARMIARDWSPRIAVNVSPREFRQADFVASLTRALTEAAVPPERLTLEITESVAIDDIDGTIGIMHELKTLGVGLSLDDFGTGFSSLTYLKRLPIDELKIDRSFVKDIPADPNDAALVESILAVSRHLGVSTVAEGVETDEQLEFLRARHCDLYQGYLFGRPRPIESFLAELDRALQANS